MLQIINKDAIIAVNFVRNVLTDLDECMYHCSNVSYTPPAYYLKQLNQLYKYYNSKTYAS